VRAEHRAEYLFGVAQIANLSVSPRIVASRDEFSERGCVRSTSRSMAAIPTRCGWVFDHSRDPFWLRLGRAALYRRLQIGRALAVFRRPGRGAVLQDGILRYSRLAVCATNTTEALTVRTGRIVTNEPDFLGQLTGRFDVGDLAIQIPG